MKKRSEGTEGEDGFQKADKTELQKLYDKHKDDKQGSYTSTSWKNFQKALEAAKTVLEDEDANMSQVDKAQAALEKAVRNLKKTSTPGTKRRIPPQQTEIKIFRCQDRR